MRPAKHQVMTRYYGWYANRPRGTRRTATAGGEHASIEVVGRDVLPLREARRRWADLLRRIYEVDPLTCPACGGAMRILAFIPEGAVIDQILAQVELDIAGHQAERFWQRPFVWAAGLLHIPLR